MRNSTLVNTYEFVEIKKLLEFIWKHQLVISSYLLHEKQYQFVCSCHDQLLC